jgi:hypothetical protein
MGGYTLGRQDDQDHGGQGPPSQKKARPKPGLKVMMVGCLQEDESEVGLLWLTTG